MDKKILGEKIREIRYKTGLNQEEFGRKIGVSKQALSTMERGLYWPDLTVLENVATLGGITLNDFSDRFATPQQIKKNQGEYNNITDRERQLINRFRELRNDQADIVVTQDLFRVNGPEVGGHYVKIGDGDI